MTDVAKTSDSESVALADHPLRGASRSSRLKTDSDLPMTPSPPRHSESVAGILPSVFNVKTELSVPARVAAVSSLLRSCVRELPYLKATAQAGLIQVSCGNGPSCRRLVPQPLPCLARDAKIQAWRHVYDNLCIRLSLALVEAVLKKLALGK